LTLENNVLLKINAHICLEKGGLEELPIYFQSYIINNS